MDKYTTILFAIHFLNGFSRTFVLMTKQPDEYDTGAEERKGPTID